MPACIKAPPSTALEAGRQRDASMQARPTSKVEQMMMKEMRITASAAERERNARAKVQRRS